MIKLRISSELHGTENKFQVHFRPMLFPYTFCTKQFKFSVYINVKFIEESDDWKLNLEFLVI